MEGFGIGGGIGNCCLMAFVVLCALRFRCVEYASRMLVYKY